MNEPTIAPIEITSDNVLSMSREDAIAALIAGQLKVPKPSAPAPITSPTMDDMVRGHRRNIQAREDRAIQRARELEEDREFRALR